MVSQRRERERPRRKHSHDHGENIAIMQNVSLFYAFNKFNLIQIFSWWWWSYLSVGGRQNGYSATRALGRGAADYDSCSSFMSSELESTSCFDSEDDDATSRSDVLSSSLDFFVLSLVGGMHQEWAVAEILQNQMFQWFQSLPHIFQQSITTLLL